MRGLMWLALVSVLVGIVSPVIRSAGQGKDPASRIEGSHARRGGGASERVASLRKGTISERPRVNPFKPWLGVTPTQPRFPRVSLSRSRKKELVVPYPSPHNLFSPTPPGVIFF